MMRVRASDGVHTAEMDIPAGEWFYAAPTVDGPILSTAPFHMPGNAVSCTLTISVSDTDDDSSSKGLMQ